MEKDMFDPWDFPVEEVSEQEYNELYEGIVSRKENIIVETDEDGTEVVSEGQ